jgi:hypothetical protein
MIGSVLSQFAQDWPWLVIWAAVGFIGGVAIGWRRNRWLLGPLLGIVLGPLGWLLVARMPSRLQECPQCSRIVAAGAPTCRHCGTDILRAASRSARANLKSVDRGGGW